MIVAFVAGVVMTMLGLSLLINGKAKIRGRKIPKVWVRRLGVFLLAFFPVILVERFLLNRFDPDEETDRILVHGCVTGFWVAAASILLLIAMRRPARPRVDVTAIKEATEPVEAAAFDAPLSPENDFGEPIPEPRVARSTKKGRGSPSQNPFDFE